jgi:Na+-driven multidrug efflux pump
MGAGRAAFGCWRGGCVSDGRALVRLAVPALGVLAAEPLYVLVDTAVVGHLGAVPLAGLA